MNKSMRRIKLMRMSRVVIVVALSLLVVLAGFTIYGNKVGNFVVSLDPGGAGLALSTADNPQDEGAWTARLSLRGLQEQTDTTYADMPIDTILEGMGTKNSPKREYIAFSFWLINTSSSAVDYSVKFSVSESAGVAADAMRVMVVEGDPISAEQPGLIYATEEQDDPEAVDGLHGEEMAQDPDHRQIHTRAEKEEYIAAHTVYETTPFASRTEIVDAVRTDFERGGAIKYTVVIWLEGWDYDCMDDIRGAKLKFELDFAIVTE